MPPCGIQTDDDVDNLFKTSQWTTSYPGTSQYATGAVSSCGMAAANFARTVIKLARSAEDPDDVLKQITSLDMIQDIMSICSLWVTAGCDAHLEVEEIVTMTSFRKAMETVELGQGLVNGGGFLETVQKLEIYAPGEKPAVAIITRIPEIVACAKIFNKRGSVYAIFDSHPRQHDHPDGAGLLLFTKPEAVASYLFELFHVDLSLDDGEWQSTEYFDIFQSQIFVDPDPPVVRLAADIEMYSVLLSQKGELERLRKEGKKPASSPGTSSTATGEILGLRKALETSKAARASLRLDNDRLKARLADACNLRDDGNRTLFTNNDAKCTPERETPLLLSSSSSEKPRSFRIRQCPRGPQASDPDTENLPLLKEDLITRESPDETQGHELMSLRRRVEELERERRIERKGAVHRQDNSTTQGKRSKSLDELEVKQTNMGDSFPDQSPSGDRLTLRELKVHILDLKHQLLRQAQPQDSLCGQKALSQDELQGRAQQTATLAPDDNFDLNLAEALQREFLRERQRDFREGREDDTRVHQRHSQRQSIAHRQPDYLLSEELRKECEAQERQCNIDERRGLRPEARNTARQIVRSHADEFPTETLLERLANIEKLVLHQNADRQGEAARDADAALVPAFNEQGLESRRLEPQERSQSGADLNHHIAPSASSSDPGLQRLRLGHWVGSVTLPYIRQDEKAENRRIGGERFDLHADDIAAVRHSGGTGSDHLPSQEQDFVSVGDEEITAQDAVIALQIQEDYSLEHGMLASEREDLTLRLLDHEQQPVMAVLSQDMYVQYDMSDADREVAERLQREYDEDNRRVAEMTALLNQETAPQQTFTCVICMEDHSTDHLAIVPHCDHRTCRDCMRAQIETTLREGRYPVFCPCCDNESDKSKIEQELIEVIGISQECYQKLEHLSVAVYAVDTTCPKCKQAFRLDREETTGADTLECPLPGCGYSWCKRCNQEVVSGLEHSCDGEKELKRLKDAGNLQYCPGCKTPCEKIEGCNHMHCRTPGCDTHFCYTCGKSLHRGAANNRRIEDKIYTHWTQNECHGGALFDTEELAEDIDPPPARVVHEVTLGPVRFQYQIHYGSEDWEDSDISEDSEDSEDSLDTSDIEDAWVYERTVV